jgi:hypothetical protein
MAKTFSAGDNTISKGATLEYCATPGGRFEIPADTPEEDIISINNVLTALMNIGAPQNAVACAYKVKTIKSGYLLRAVLPESDIFEFSLEDLLFLHSVSPARVERVNIVRSQSGGPSEIVVKIINSKQPIMVVSTLHFAIATHKRKFESV